MRQALGIALAAGVSVISLVAAFEWLVRTFEPTDEQRESLKTHWLLWQSGILRREK